MAEKLMAYNEVDVHEVDAWLENDEWELQQKIDGIRARLRIHKKVEIVNAGGNPLVSTTAAPVVEKMKEFGSRVKLEGINLELDGEIVGDKFYVFDVPFNDFEFGGCIEAQVNHDSPWFDRRYVLEFLFDHLDEFFNFRSFDEKPSAWLELVPTFVGTKDKKEAWNWIVETGVEGGILKHKDGPVIDNKRVDHILKAKITHTIDCFVIEKGPGNGVNGTGNHLKLGLFKTDGTSYEVGRCSFIGKNYAEEGDVVEVKYLYCGTGGRLVQPVMLKKRDDKKPEDCTTRQLHFVSKKILQDKPAEIKTNVAANVAEKPKLKFRRYSGDVIVGSRKIESATYPWEVVDPETNESVVVVYYDEERKGWTIADGKLFSTRIEAASQMVIMGSL